MGRGEDPPQWRRVRRAKGDREGQQSLVDGGAIAVGLVVMLVAFFPTVLVPLPSWASLGLLGVGLLVGSYLTGRLSVDTVACGACQGLVLAISFISIVLFVTVATRLAPGPSETAVVLGQVQGLPRVDSVAVLITLGLGAVGAMVGRRIASR